MADKHRGHAAHGHGKRPAPTEAKRDEASEARMLVAFTWRIEGTGTLATRTMPFEQWLLSGFGEAPEHSTLVEAVIQGWPHAD